MLPKSLRFLLPLTGLAGLLSAASAGTLSPAWGEVGELLMTPGEDLAYQLSRRKTPRDTRRAIPVALALSADFERLPALVKASSSDRDPRTRESAVVAMTYLGSLIRRFGDVLPGIGGDTLAAITDALSQALKDKSSGVRGQAAAGIAALGVAVPEVFEALVDLMQDTEEPLVQDAALALGHFHSRLEDAKAALAPRLKDKREAVRVSAAAALVRLGQAGEPAEGILVAGLKSPHPDAREAAVSALALFDGPGIIPALWKALDDPDTEVRVAAANALATKGAAARITGARLNRALLHDRFPSVRAAAAMALARVLEDEAIPALSAALDQRQGEVGVWVGIALVSLGQPGVHVLENAAAGPSARAKRSALIALALAED